MTAWTEVAASQVDADSPLDEDLMGALRTNDIAMRQAILLSVFDEFAGDGSDGARSDTVTGTFATGASKQLSSWTVDAGQTITITDSNSHNVAYIGVSGTFTLNGTLTRNSQGYAGAAGGTTASKSNSYGAYGEQPSWVNSGGGGGGGGGQGSASGAGGDAYTTPSLLISGGAGAGSGGGLGSAGTTGYLVRVFGTWFHKLSRGYYAAQTPGAGGGAGYDNAYPVFQAGGAGGAGGGGLLIECDEFVFASGASITSTGAAGSAGTSGLNGAGGGGGGGPGGWVVIVCRKLTTNSGTITVTGGAGGGGGTASSTGYHGGAGGAGSAGFSSIVELG